MKALALALALVKATAIVDLPLVEVPTASSAHPRTMAILLSGDGGWTSMDRMLAAGLAKEGIPTVGLNSLRYFWQAKTPAAVATDLTEIMTYYRAAWHRPDVLLIGYSFGADALPAAVARLPKELANAVTATVLIGPSHFATFEIRLAEWMNLSVDRSMLVAPDLAKLEAAKVVCIFGKRDATSLCPALAAPVEKVAYDTGHRMNDAAPAIAKVIVARAEPGRNSQPAGRLTKESK